MTARERRLYLLILTFAMVATVIPFVCQFSRLAGGRALGNLTEIAFVLALPLMPMAPVLIVCGLGYSLWIRARMASREQAPAGRPSILIFIGCGLVWILVGYTFRLVPLFAGESTVQRGWIDGWLDRLL